LGIALWLRPGAGNTLPERHRVGGLGRHAAGSYNIYLRAVSGGKSGPLLTVTNSNRFHAHPSLAVDQQDRVWLAYDEGTENWGQDQGFLLSGARDSIRPAPSGWPSMPMAAGLRRSGSYYRGDRRSELIPVPESMGRNEAELQVAANSKDNGFAAILNVAWSSPIWVNYAGGR